MGFIHEGFRAGGVGRINTGHLSFQCLIIWKQTVVVKRRHGFQNDFCHLPLSSSLTDSHQPPLAPKDIDASTLGRAFSGAF